MADIVIIDYGMGNVHSVAKALTNILDKKSTKFTKSKEFGSGRSSEKIFKILNSKGFWNTDVQKHFMRNRKN